MPEPEKKDVNKQDAAPSSGGTQPSANGDGGEQSVPYARFKEVNEELKRWKALGLTYEETEQALDSFAELVQRQSAPQAGANGGANGSNGQSPTDMTKAWENWLLKSFPWMNDMKTSHEHSRDEAEERNKWMIARARKALTKLAKDSGYSEDQVDALEHAISGLIYGNDDLRTAWRFGDVSAVNEAFDMHRKGFVEPAAKQFAAQVNQRKAANRAELPAKVNGGTAPPAPVKPRPKNLEEARALAMDKLAESAPDMPEDMEAANI